ncbi:hypothetical protein G9F71_019645 [Clostridium sp. FP2]|uniref:hypothetical protein n=1 Tax=Clostridium sp. FP2 TaxID=2724481 RepID=UPI0013E98046|nr:hypothetical protein [Clostridium sp. FP2]MBZ9625060.1 hypothetical protein [Clostridium sp. FP2]
MNKEIIMNLYEIQPSQLYVNSMKLQKVLSWFKPEDINSYEAIPIKKLNNKIIFTDGHTRAYAAYLNGINEIKVYWDEDDLDWDAYQICVDWCINENINSIVDLEKRIISDEEYKVLWLQKCKVMHEELENK